MKRILFYIILSLSLSSWVLAQETAPEQNRIVHLEHANTLSFDKSQDVERQVLRGEVLFRQDSVWMLCDSAYFYQSSNSFEAFSHVHMWEGDSLEMWCDSLSYDGNSMIGELYDNVRMRHFDAELHTEYLIYYRQEGKAHYPYSGWIVNPDNHLVSDLGWYYTPIRLAEFKNNVILRDYDFSDMEERPAYPDITSEEYKPQMTIYSDTLRYSFLTSDAWMVGPSTIVNDTATLYTTLGTVNTETDQSWLYNRSRVVSPGRFATADTLFYDGKAGYGEAWGNFVAYDTLQSMRISGNYAHYVDSPQVMTVTQKALAMEFSDKDTLYLHADTLRAYTSYRNRTVQVRRDTLVMRDSLMADSVYFVDSAYVDTINYLVCFFNVRYFRNDFQGVCDSLNYNRQDSLATFVGNPVMWNENYQITGDTIFMYMAPGGGIDRALIHDQAFLTQQYDSIHYDQISGKELICYFDSAKIKELDMAGNVQIIAYTEEGKGEEKALSGMTQVVGSYLQIHFVDQKMEHMVVYPQPVGSYYDILLITPDVLYLEGFRWMSYLRPDSPEDVFRDVRMKAEDKKESVRLFDDSELNGW